MRGPSHSLWHLSDTGTREPSWHGPVSARIPGLRSAPGAPTSGGRRTPRPTSGDAVERPTRGQGAGIADSNRRPFPLPPPAAVARSGSGSVAASDLTSDAGAHLHGTRRQQGEPTDWVTRAADDAIRHAAGAAPRHHLFVRCQPVGPGPPGQPARVPDRPTSWPRSCTVAAYPPGTCTSGTTLDRFRKVPAGVDPSWADHIGRPLSAVPDPWDCHASWAEHFKAPLRDALHAIGVDMEEMSQTERYRAGVYREQVLLAVRHRDDIDAVLAKYRTKKREPASEEEADELADSVAGGRGRRRRGGGRARTVPVQAVLPPVRSRHHAHHVVRRRDDRSRLHLHLGRLLRRHQPRDPGRGQAGVEGRLADALGVRAGRLRARRHGPRDPGSSFTVGHDWWSLFGMPRPAWFGYAFVGFAGVQKMSSSTRWGAHAGRRPAGPRGADPAVALRPPPTKQAFNIDFGPEVVRLYDEWDALGRKAADPSKRDAAVLAFERASETPSAGRLPTPRVVVPFRTLSSVADVTAGSAALISQVIEHVGYAHASVDDLEPRLDKAMAWTAEFVPESDRTIVRTRRTSDRLTSLSPRSRVALALLDNLPASSTLDAGHRRWSTASPSRPRPGLTTPRPTRSRPTRRSSSGSSTTSSSARTAALGCQPSRRARAERVRSLLGRTAN